VKNVFKIHHCVNYFCKNDNYKKYEKNGENVTPGGENVTPGGENVTPGGENVTPGGENVTPGGENVTPGGENVTPGGENVTPYCRMTEKNIFLVLLFFSKCFQYVDICFSFYFSISLLKFKVIDHFL